MTRRSTRQKLEQRILQTAHAIQRAKERYEIELNDKDIGRIISLIQTRQAVDVSLKFRNSRSVFRLKYLNTEIYPVYDGRTQTIATFLTKEMSQSDFNKSIGKS